MQCYVFVCPYAVSILTLLFHVFRDILLLLKVCGLCEFTFLLRLRILIYNLFFFPKELMCKWFSMKLYLKLLIYQVFLFPIICLIQYHYDIYILMTTIASVNYVIMFCCSFYLHFWHGHLGTSKFKAVAGKTARTAPNKATPLTFLKKRRLLHLFSSIGTQTSDIASHFVTWRELFKTLTWMPRATLDYLFVPHQLCFIPNTK